MTTKQIIIGLDGSQSSRHALDWAAVEAARRKEPLMITHASDIVDSAAISTGTPLAVLTECATYGEELLSEAAATISEKFPELAVSTLLHRDAAADVLLQLGRSASMIVVGTHGDGRVMSVVLGSVSQRVAAHATCPVVVINRNGVLTGDRRAVVVGVSESAGGTAALRFAWAEAASRGAVVVAVRAYGVFGRSGHTEIYAPLPGLKSREGAVLHDAVALMRAEFPDVVVEPRLVDQAAVESLPRLAEGADLLVLGCHHPDEHWPSRLGAISSALLHRSPCPVVVVGLAPADALNSH